MAEVISDENITKDDVQQQASLSDANSEESVVAANLRGLQDSVLLFWSQHHGLFSKWWLSLPSAAQRIILKIAGPDLPSRRRAKGLKGKPTDVLVPELNFLELLSESGKGLVYLLESQVKPDAAKLDARFLYEQHRAGNMPLFADPSCPPDALFAFIDPKAEDSLHVRILPNTASAEAKEAVKTQLEEGILIDADVFLTLQVRQATLWQFFLAIFKQFQTKFVSGDIREVFALSNSFEQAKIGCRRCGASTCDNGQPLGKCSSCDMVFYCSKEHQKIDWPLHKEDCKRIRAERQRERENVSG